MIQLTANSWNEIIASRYHLPDLALARKYRECVSVAATIKYNMNGSHQKSLSYIHASLQVPTPNIILIFHIHGSSINV